MTSGTLRSLFGGALLSAGLASAAHGQHLTHDYSAVFAYTGNYGYFPFDFQYFFGAGPFSVTSSLQGATASMTATDSYVRVSGASLLPNYLATTFDLQNDFRIDQDASVRVEWDFSADNASPAPSYMRLTDLSNGVDLVTADALNNPVGTAVVPLSSLAQYETSGQVTGWNGAGESYFKVSVVPSPGAAGLLGLAGLTGARRRRGAPRGR